MGTIGKNGLLYGMRGKVGPVVVAKYTKDKSIVRILPNQTRKAPKFKQKVQRTRFGAGRKFVLSALSFITIGYRNNKSKDKPLDAACSYHMKNAVQGEYPNFTIDPSKIMISIDHGGLKYERTAKMALIKNNTIQLTWDTTGKYNPCELLVRNHDQALFLLYNETKATVHLAEKTWRKDGAAMLSIPSIIRGDLVHGYFFFAAKDGKVSNSQYLGSIQLTAINARKPKPAVPDKL